MSTNKGDTMFKNYLIVAFRNIKKNKTQSIINISGLAVGMAVFLLITIYCRNELNYNKFFSQHENIYQIEIGDDYYTAAPLGTMIKNNIPDFKTVVRIDDNGLGGGEKPLIETREGNNSKKMIVTDIIFADDKFFDMFNFPVLYGNPSTALKEPYSIVLTKSTAVSLFGVGNVVGRSIHYIGDRNSQPQMDMIITAVIDDVPNNTSISFNSSKSFNAVGSLSTYYSIKPSGSNIEEDWSNRMYSTFVMFKQNNINLFTEKVNKLWYDQERTRGNSHVNINMIPLDDVHFHNNSKRQIIFLLQLIGFLIMGIAIINFINLTIARSSSRAREIGMRKVVGANRLMLVKQFLSESIFISLLAMPIALLIVTLFKPVFFKMIDKEIPFDILYKPQFILILFAGIIVIGIISGIYPAVVLSSFKPTSILKGEITKSKKGNLLRHMLIVFQFTISISLVICTILISKQMDYLKTKDLGFNNKNIIYFSQSQQINQKYDVFKQKLLQNPDIINVSRSNTSFGKDLPIGLESDFKGLKKSYRATTADPDFIPTMKIEMVKGRQFSWDIQSDHYMTAIVNETFVKEFQLKQPLGSEINFFTIKPKIIGVMKDFNYNSFHQKVEPAALLDIDWNMEINVRISNRDIPGTIQYIKNIWNKFSPDMPFEFKFLDQTYGALYISEEQFQSIISSFSIIAIIIACLGLFGLISYSINRRLKEISIRKILGASVDSIVLKLTGELLKWVVLANLLAWPLAWFLMNKWLQNFAYHTSMSWWIFILSGGIALLIAMLTVSYQAIRAATANPIETLRYE